MNRNEKIAIAGTTVAVGGILAYLLMTRKTTTTVRTRTVVHTPPPHTIRKTTPPRTIRTRTLSQCPPNITWSISSGGECTVYNNLGQPVGSQPGVVVINDTSQVIIVQGQTTYALQPGQTFCAGLYVNVIPTTVKIIQVGLTPYNCIIGTFSSPTTIVLRGR